MTAMGKTILNWFYTIVIALIISILVGIFLIQPYKVDGHSMDPTLHDRERIFVSKLSHTLSNVPDYGAIVIIDSRVNRNRTVKDEVLESPIIQLLRGSKEQIFYVKRVIGKPGDVLELKGQHMYRNGKLLNEPYLLETMAKEPVRTWKVPANHIFVMGDNRNHSRDSRDIGFVPLDHVMGTKIP